MKAERAVDSIRIRCRTDGQTEHLSGFGVNQFDSAPALVRSISDARGANANAAGNVIEIFSAQKAFVPSHAR
jgi:hypothetical protein